jgi:hypothetical protein
MSKMISPNDPRITWQGAVSLNVTDEWTMPWRLPYDKRGLFPPEALLDRAAMPAGVRISFISDTTSVTVYIAVKSEDPQFIDVYYRGKFFDSIPVTEVGRIRSDGLPTGEQMIELWLPQHGEVRISSIEIDDDANIAPFDDNRPKWVTYGSSITHCRAAESPAMTWPAIVAREHGLNLTCLGYGGNCHLEPMIARIMRELPADYLSMKVGINIYGSGSLNTRTFKAAIIGFVNIIREKHPDTPFVVVSPIFSPPRETTRNAVEFTLQDMREEVAEAVELMKAHGDGNIHYVDGLKVFGPENAHMLPDELHPDAKGYKLLAQNFLKEAAKLYFV